MTTLRGDGLLLHEGDIHTTGALTVGAIDNARDSDMEVSEIRVGV